MAWCPNCKTEYRDNIATCADCNTPLVAELTEETTTHVAFINDSDKAEKFLEFLKFSGVNLCCMEYNTVEEAFEILVTKAHEKEAKKLFGAFRTTETMMEHQLSSHSEKEMKNEEPDAAIPLAKMIPESSLTYVKKEDRYNDTKSSAYIFAIFGVVGIIFTLLNVFGVLTLFNSWIQFLVLGATSIAFIFIGFHSWKQSKQLFSEIGHENEITTQINDWLNTNITTTVLSQFDDPTSSDEVNFLKKLEYIKEQLLNRFEIDSEAYLDQLIEEYYNEHFE